MHTAVLYEGPAGTRVRTETTSITGAAHDELAAVARERVAEGATRIELCGGVGAATHAAVQAAVGDVPVGLNRYAFESLERIAAYKQAFGGPARTGELFVYREDGADPTRDHVVDGSARFVGVSDEAEVGPLAAALARELGDEGLGLIELYAGLGASAATVALDATGGRVPVGFV